METNLTCLFPQVAGAMHFADAGSQQQPRRFRWTPELHARFLTVLAALGGADAAKTGFILALMSDVQGLARRHVEAHLSKVKRIRELHSRQFDGASPAAEAKHPSSADSKRREVLGALGNALLLQLHTQMELHKHLEVRERL